MDRAGWHSDLIGPVKARPQNDNRAILLPDLFTNNRPAPTPLAVAERRNEHRPAFQRRVWEETGQVPAGRLWAMAGLVPCLSGCLPKPKPGRKINAETPRSAEHRRAGSHARERGIWSAATGCRFGRGDASPRPKRGRVRALHRLRPFAFLSATRRLCVNSLSGRLRLLATNRISTVGSTAPVGRNAYRQPTRR